MIYSVNLTARAEADVADVLRWFVENDAAEAGARWLQRLNAKLDMLRSNPRRCPLALVSEEFREEVREILLGHGRYKHRILFTVGEETVSILRIWHSSRDQFHVDDL